MIQWRNKATLLLFRSILEDWDFLETIATCLPDPEELARNIRGAFSDAFARGPCPLIGFLCQQGLETVDFVQAANELLQMIARQREHQTKGDQGNGGTDHAMG